MFVHVQQMCLFVLNKSMVVLQCCNDVVQERYASELKYDVALRLAALHVHQHALSSNMQGKVSIKSIEWVVTVGLHNQSITSIYINPLILSSNMQGRVSVKV